MAKNLEHLYIQVWIYWYYYC